MKQFDIELFGWQFIDKGWWNITLFRIAFVKISWHFLMIEQNRDELFIQFFTFNKANG